MRASLFVLPFLSSCSVLIPTVSECTAHSQCSEAFGVGSLCGDDGFCSVDGPPARCAQTVPPDLFVDGVVSPDVFLLGALFDQQHYPEQRAVELAIKQANAVGGLFGRSFGLIECQIAEDATLDSLTEDEAIVAMADYLVDGVGLTALVGPSTSAQVTVAFEHLVDRQVVLVSPSATAAGLMSIDVSVATDEAPGFLWRTAGPDGPQGEAIAADMTARGISTVAVVYQENGYGSGLNNSFVQYFGGVVNSYGFDSATVRQEHLATVSAGQVDEVLFIGSLDEVISFLNGVPDLTGLDSTNLFFTDSAAKQELLSTDRGGAPVLSDAARAILDRVRGTRPEPLNDRLVYQAFKSAYAAEYSNMSADESAFTAHAYDATWMLLYGLAWSDLQEGTVSGLGVARGLRKLSAGKSIEVRPSRWEQGLSEFAAGRGFDLVGASGSLDFDPTTEETVVAVNVWRIQDDSIVSATGAE